jgi:hypothetical protein
VSALFGLPPPLTRWLAIAMVAAVVALVGWALQLMQAATDRQDFSLMLAGCMVCSAAVGLSTVMVLTFTSPETFAFHHGAPAIESLKASTPINLASEAALPWTAWDSLSPSGVPIP